MAKNQKLIVEVVDARDLLPKDGHGTSSPYVMVDFYGQRKRTHTAIRDLNPSWNEVLEFNVGKPSNVFGNTLELDVYHDKNHGPTTRNNFLGRIRLSSTQFVKKGEEALIYYPLQKKQLFSWIQGEIGLKIYYQDEVVPPPTPPKEEEKPETKIEPKPEPEPEPEGKVPDDVGAKEGEEAKPNVEDSTPVAAPAPKTDAEETSPPPPAADTAASPLEVEKPQEPNIPTPPPPSPPPQPQQENPSSEPYQPESTLVDDTFDMISESSWSPPQRMASAIPEVKCVGVTAPALPLRTISSPASINFNTSLESQESNVSMERTSFDLVEKMHYLFVRVIKARFLPTNRSPIVSISALNYRVSTKPARKMSHFEWEETFAFARESPDSSSSVLEVSIWDPQKSNPIFLGGICFDVSEIPLRDPPDSPLAPQWYRLEGGGAHRGDLMLATWIGTQADESFPDAWKTTDTANSIDSRAKVYLSPKLWYLRATILEAQDVTTSFKESTWQVKVQLASQVNKTKLVIPRNGNLTWNEDLLFVAAEPFSDQHLVFTVENRQPKGSATAGVARIALTSVERRVDDRKVTARWLSLEDPKCDQKMVKYNGRIQLRLCFDGGYHVMDEAAHVCSDYRPTARQLWKQPVGSVELGIIGCKNLLPIKTVDGKGCVDSYCVAKYGPKWVRTRTVCDSLDPKWNEQYTWKVYDPCTVLSIGVFDSSGVAESDGEKTATRLDFRIGKVRIRISTLETGKVYKNRYPLTLLTSTGVKTMGEVELAVRFIRATPTLDLLHVYSQPLLPLMHHIKPLGVVQQEILRSTAAKITALHLSRSEPPLRREVVLYMLDADSHAFSMRKVRANYYRIIKVIAGVIDIVRWVENTRVWKNPTSTILVHTLLVMLVWFPDLIIPSLAFYVFVIGAWNYRFRFRDPLPHLDPKLSLADAVDRDELDEEFDTMPSTRSPDIIRVRYDKLRAIGIRVQTILGDFATQGERMQALVIWRDPRATGIFVGLCFVVAMILYLVPSKMIAMAFGFYYFRHPIFRDRMPSPALNFFRRLPSLADRIM